jgi:hypothetical protein
MSGLDAISETVGAAAVELAASALIERGGAVTACANCTASVIGPYCAVCGQSRDTHRRSVFRLLHDLFEDISSFDSRTLRTVWALVGRPGELPLAFREGRTQRYVPPVRLYLFVSLAFFLTLSMTGIAILQLALVVKSHRYMADKAGHVYEIDPDGTKSLLDDFWADSHGNVYVADDKDDQKSHVAVVDDKVYVADRSDGKGVRVAIPDMKADGLLHDQISTNEYFFAPLGKVPAIASQAARAQLDRTRKHLTSGASRGRFGSWIKARMNRTIDALAADPAAVNGPLTDWIPRVLFIVLPLYALLLGVFYWRQRQQFFFVDHLVFSLNIHTFGFLLLLVAVGMSQLVQGGWIAFFALVAMGVYLLLAMKRFYAQSWFWTGFKFVTLSVIYSVFFLFPALIGILLAGMLNV